MNTGLFLLRFVWASAVHPSAVTLRTNLLDRDSRRHERYRVRQCLDHVCQARPSVHHVSCGDFDQARTQARPRRLLATTGR